LKLKFIAINKNKKINFPFKHIGDIDSFCSVTGRRILQVPLKCDKYIILQDWLLTMVEAHIVESKIQN